MYAKNTFDSRIAASADTAICFFAVQAGENPYPKKGFRKMESELRKFISRLKGEKRELDELIESARKYGRQHVSCLGFIECVQIMRALDTMGEGIGDDPDLGAYKDLYRLCEGFRSKKGELVEDEEIEGDILEKLSVYREGALSTYLTQWYQGVREITGEVRNWLKEEDEGRR
jgi:hypothetical protein